MNYLDDPIAELLRTCMLDKEMPFDIASKYPLHGKIPFWWADEPLLPFWLDEPDALIGVGLLQSGFIVVYVRVFGSFQALLKVTNTPDRYPSFQQQFVAIDSTTGHTRQSTLEEEIVRMRLH